MLRVAYLANKFPSPVEPYVAAEIEELRKRGLNVIAGSARKLNKNEAIAAPASALDMVILQPIQLVVFTRALWLCLRHWRRIGDLLRRIALEGHESLIQRIKAVLHTWLGACYAAQLKGRAIEHIHVHHGYFGSWIAMVAARLLKVDFSLTLHGSDLLLHGTYLDTKLKNCRFCLTISEFNRRYVLEHFPRVEAEKILVTRLGVDTPELSFCPDLQTQTRACDTYSEFTILTVGRLHQVKDHALLLRACAQLRARGVRFDCSIAGEGPERHKLESLIRRYGLEDQVTLLGHLPHKQIDSLYARADVVVLTSRSEGIPLVLMEAMARGKIVLAPAITGIPELVIAGKSGFLYEPGSLGDLVAKLLFIHSLSRSEGAPQPEHLYPYILSAAKRLDWMRHAAQVQIRHNYNRKKNLESFADLFIRRTA